MDNKELFDQVIAAMQEQTEVISKMMDEKIQKSETSIKVYLENQVSKRIDALYDGYKLTHEKQWEMERELEDLKRRVERLESLDRGA